MSNRQSEARKKGKRAARKHTDGGCWCGAFHGAALRAASKAAQLRMMPLRAALKKYSDHTEE